MDDVITIFQDYKQNIIQYKEHFPVIQEFKNLIGEQNLILQTDGSVQIKNYVGFIQKGKTKIQVLPKIYWGSEIQNNEIEDSMSFLFRLLGISGYFTFKALDEIDIAPIKKNAFEILIRIFIDMFLKEFNKVPNYEYISRIEKQQIIKGKILFLETLKQNSSSCHQHVVEYDEFSIDNKLNQLFKYIIQELIKSTNDSKNRMRLRQGLVLLEEVSALYITPEFFNSIQLNRQNQQYYSLFNFAKLFFFNNQPGLSAGKERTFSFLIPLNLLFEKTVKVILQDIENRNSDIKLKYHNHLYFGTENSKDRFCLEPDFLLVYKDKNKKPNTIAVLDTKFKNPFRADSVLIADSDLYQLTTYATAYDTNLIFVIYPVFQNSPSKETSITKYYLKTRDIKTKLVLLQIDITDDNLLFVKEKLHRSILSELDFITQEFIKNHFITTIT